MCPSYLHRHSTKLPPRRQVNDVHPRNFCTKPCRSDLVRPCKKHRAEARRRRIRLQAALCDRYHCRSCQGRAESAEHGLWQSTRCENGGRRLLGLARRGALTGKTLSGRASRAVCICVKRAAGQDDDTRTGGKTSPLRTVAHRRRAKRLDDAALVAIAEAAGFQAALSTLPMSGKGQTLTSACATDATIALRS